MAHAPTNEAGVIFLWRDLSVWSAGGGTGIQGGAAAEGVSGLRGQARDCPGQVGAGAD